MAKAMSEREKRRSRAWADYSDRSGFSRGAEEMRGAARRDFQTPPEMAANRPVETELVLQ